MLPDPHIQTHVDHAAALALGAGERELGEAILRLGLELATNAVLSFDDEALAREVVARLSGAAAPVADWGREPSVAIAAAHLLLAIDDREIAGGRLVALFAAHRASGDVAFLASGDVLRQLVACGVALDEHPDALGWAFTALPAPERARWASVLAAACFDVGTVAAGGWIAVVSSCIADDRAFADRVRDGFVEYGLEPSNARHALASYGRISLDP